MKQIPDELREILATTPAKEVIAKIEALNPTWKWELLPWRITPPGEKIPWQAVYGLIEQEITEEDMAWARRKIVELGLAEDA